MSLANRFLYLVGRELSEDGRVGSFQSPKKSPKVQDLTGPFQTRPTKKQTGYTDWGPLTVSVWSETDLETLTTPLRGSDTTLDEMLVVWGEDTDAVGSQCYAGNLLKVSITPKTEPASFTEYAVEMVPDLYGFEEVKSLRAMATATGDGDTESTPDNNGVMGAAVNLTSSSIANPTVITTATAHGLTTGDTVLIAGHTSTPTINGSRVVTVTGTTTFTIPINVTTGGGAAGTMTRTSSRSGGTAYVQISANAPDTATGLSFIVRHSPDGATWATQGTFTTTTTAVSASDVGAGNALRLLLSGVIDRYTAIKWDYTGTAGTAAAVFAAFIARNETYTA